MNSYPKVYNIGHPAISDLFDGPVVVQEKVDGSQLSFTLPEGAEVPLFRSRGTNIHLDDVPDLFRPAVEKVCSVVSALVYGWVYRAEAICRPRHNTLTYDRVPEGGLVLFDIMGGEEDYLDPITVIGAGLNLGIEVVPTFDVNTFTNHEQILELLERVSFLGGTKVEGVVVKNYKRFGRDGKPLFGKYVSEAFKETHKKQWKSDNPGRGDIIELIATELRSEARWEKAIQHREEAGELLNAPQDIGPLLNSIKDDILEEEADHIRERLFKWAQRMVLTRATRGFPEWYKERLLEGAFK